MPRAKRLIAGAKSISARNINKAIEQANRTDSFQGGTGLTSANDPTGMQMINARRNPTPDGNSPFGLSTSITSAIEFPTRKTLKMRSDATRHKKEWELFGSSGVSQKAIAPSSSRPQRYGIPHLPTSSSGSGSLTWGTMDADEFGTSGPRSLERRVSGSGERFQIYNFDAAASVLGSSEVTQTPVRRRFGSSGNHYIAWVNSSDLEGGATVPRWNEVLDATSTTHMEPDVDETRTLYIGDEFGDKSWDKIYIASVTNMDIGTDSSGTTQIGHHSGTAACKIVFTQHLGIYAGSLGGYVKMFSLPTTDPSVSGALFTRTASQLGASGSEKVICIS